MEHQLEDLLKYKKGTVCENIKTGQRFICSGQLTISDNGSGIFDSVNKHFIYLVIEDKKEFAKILFTATEFTSLITALNK